MNNIKLYPVSWNKKPHMKYSINNTESIIDKNTLLLTHADYGDGIWTRAEVPKRVKRKCAVLNETIASERYCFMPNITLPYSRDVISIRGVKQLIRSMRVKLRNKRKKKVIKKDKISN